MTNVRTADEAARRSPRATPKKACGPSIAWSLPVDIDGSPSVSSIPRLVRCASSDQAPDHISPA